MRLEHLSVGEGERLRAIRLRSLQDAPDTFGTTFEDAAAWSLESWNRQLEQFATFVATADGSDVGLVRGALHDRFHDAGYLISMWVSPDARRQGVGSALVDAVVRWARNRGLSRLYLDVTELNTAAISLYTRTGFVRTGDVGALPPPREDVQQIQMVMRL
jgi:ribosomal protein S18 acetylase RimI-like enzyme